MKSLALTVVGAAVYQAPGVQATGGYDPYLVNYRGYEHEPVHEEYDHYDYTHGHMNEQAMFLSAEDEY